jgi:heme A synthase
MTAYQRLCIVTCGVIFVLIIVGGIVRATDSGLGCPDWPTCHGRLIPDGNKHTIIEYSHRFTATVVGFLVLAITIGAWRSFRSVPAVLWPANAAFVLLLVQAGLGAAVVANELPPGIVAVHLVLALSLMTLLLIVTTATFAAAGPVHAPSVSPRFGRLALGASAATLVLAVAGSYVAGAGYGLACSGWPLCNGQVFPNADANSVQIHFFHRLMAAIVGIVLVTLAYQGWKLRKAEPLVANLTALALGVYLVQALIGAANIWTKLADEVSAAHLGGAALLWTVLAVLNIRVHRLHELLPYSSSSSPNTNKLAGAPR